MGVSVRVSVPPNRPVVVLVGVPLWLLLFTAGLVASGSVASVGAGLVAVVVVGALWLWLIAGREEVETGGGRLTLRRRVGPLRHERSFAASEIADLRALPPSGRGWRGAFAVTRASIAFEHGGRTHAFGGGLRPEEARRLAARLREELR